MYFVCIAIACAWVCIPVYLASASPISQYFLEAPFYLLRMLIFSLFSIMFSAGSYNMGYICRFSSFCSFSFFSSIVVHRKCLHSVSVSRNERCVWLKTGKVASVMADAQFWLLLHSRIFVLYIFILHRIGFSFVRIRCRCRCDIAMQHVLQ